jgi:hypothetical protein
MEMTRQVTIEIGGHELRCDCDISPEEPQTRDHPGSPLSIEVTKVRLFVAQGQPTLDITDLIDELDGAEIVQALVEDVLSEEDEDGDEDDEE